MAGFSFNFCVEEDTRSRASAGGNNGGSPERAEVLDKQSGRDYSSGIMQPTETSSSQADHETEKVSASKEHPILPFHRELLDHVIPSRFQLSASPSKSPHQLQILYVDANNIEQYAKNGVCAKKGTPGSGSKNRPESPPGSDIDSVARQTGLTTLLELSNSCHSDLIPGVYEGGLKVWECAFDLVDYLAELKINFSGMRVLELGCGAGLPATFALIKGAREVHFQDYNPEVIDHVTIPSVLLNLPESKFADCGYKFYSGDWSNFIELIPSGYYDIILTSETIYSPASQPKLLAALKHLLRPQGGVAYIATKSYYFGVGGSVSLFKELVEKDGCFDIEKCHIVDCEISREILKLQSHK